MVKLLSPSEKSYKNEEGAKTNKQNSIKVIKSFNFYSCNDSSSIDTYKIFKYFLIAKPLYIVVI